MWPFRRVGRSIALLLIILFGFGPSRAAAPVAVDLELVLAVDVSRSIDDDEFMLQKHGYARAFTNPAVLSAIQASAHRQIAVTYVEWSGADFQKVVVPWTLVSDAESGQLFSEALLRAPRSFAGWTSISGAIDFSVPLFGRGGFQGTRRVIDVSGDGVNNSGRPAASARDDAIAAGITINGLVIMDNDPNPGMLGQSQPALDEFYRDNVVGGPGAFVVAIKGFDTFAQAIMNKMVREIAAVPRPDTATTAESQAARRRGG